MSRLPPRPDLSWKEDGTPVAGRVGDVYFSRHNGLEETRTVFLQGCGLPGRWKGQPSFTIGELGFGTGLNFLAAWQLWRETRLPGQWLHFVSFEGYPLDRADAARALSAWPELGDLSSKLAEAWPERAYGVQRMVQAEDGVTLTLHTGEISETLPQASMLADAWFLDGFSPAKNDGMWAETLWPLVRERCREGAVLSTFTVAGSVRRGLAAAGFEVEKRPGFGRKRERLEVRIANQQARQPDPYALRPFETRAGKVRIVGAGIAGACATRTLLDRGLEVEVIDAATGPAEAASGNPLGLVMPRLDAGDTVQARLLIDAYLAARRFYAGRPGVTETGVAQRPKDEREAERIAKILADPPLGLENLEALSGGGQLHKQALIIEPATLIPSLLEGANCRFGETIRMEGLQDETPTILATGYSITSLLDWLQVEGRLGQVESCRIEVDSPAFALAQGDYCIALGETRLWGATFEPWTGGEIAVNDAAQDANMAALERLDPYWRQMAQQAEIVSRAGVRATTPDRLPLIGRAPDPDEAMKVFDGVRHGQPLKDDAPLAGPLLIAGGFGSRGFTWGPWAGEILAGLLLSEPAPATISALQAVSPMRQILRRLKRGG
ncbi:tRNA (5-methylaminomethyl-2-thiouridine)(34)-methyltransferase MnmD [Henriciella sp.]|uniref:tRNA (5-methylaminomethyl-2-thiouridine)(34)-methyltransferase MnmD n=1 Tax=Henriciella sp. TaxID=1968823 RepID=UPI0026094115|nr:tRNA (5-methylaminomethyl-2-thiouridine)(34)-methyltransferase MnmD [Henriciella sp.]